MDGLPRHYACIRGKLHTTLILPQNANVCLRLWPNSCTCHLIGLLRARDRTYEKVKTALWDIFPTWEDDHYDRYFKEMMWASLGGALAHLGRRFPNKVRGHALGACSRHLA